jgi:hypothetical protein
MTFCDCAPKQRARCGAEEESEISPAARARFCGGGSRGERKIWPGNLILFPTGTEHLSLHSNWLKPTLVWRVARRKDRKKAAEDVTDKMLTKIKMFKCPTAARISKISSMA